MIKFAVALTFAFSGAAWAQTGELWFDLGQSLLSNSGIGTTQAIGGTGNDVQLTDGFRFGFRFGFNQGEHFGHEVQYAYNRTQLQFNTNSVSNTNTVSKTGMAIHQSGYNFLYYLTSDKSKIRPFGTAGVHFDNFVPPGNSVSSGGGSTKIGANFGGGVKVRIKGIWAARVDVREYFTPKPSFGLALNSGTLRQTEISAGVGIGF
jgi:hypothetical protein